MARKKIQGITIEIGGKTDKLQDALKKVENKLRGTQAALRDVNKLLKLDPGNTELLTQKQKLLNETYDATKDKLNTLEDTAAQMREQMENGADVKDEYDALQREIIETKQQMQSLTDEMKDFGSVTAQQMKAAGEKVKDVGEKIGKVGTAMTKYVTAPIVAAGAASVAAFNEVDDGLDIIVKKTGATGDALADMEGRAMNLATSIPTDFKTAGEAVGEVNTRFGLVGDELEELSGQFIKFAALNDTDVTSSVDNVQAAMAAFNLDADMAGVTLNILNKAAQDTGTDVNKLSSDLTSNAAALQEMGFSIQGAAGFLANLNKNGLDSSTVLTGMKKALQTATKNGMSMSQALKKMEKSIVNAKSETKAMQAATELFGSKAAPAMVKALREGRISFDDISNSVKDWSFSVERTFEETQDPIDDFKMALNELKIIGLELVEAAAPLIREIARLLQNAFATIRGWWGSLSPYAQETIVKLAAIAAALGPVLIVVGKLTSAVGSIMTLAPKIVGIIETVKTGLSALWAVMAANPITLVIAAVAALVAGFIYLWNKSEKFREFWKNLWEKVKNIAVGAWDKIMGTFKKAVEKIEAARDKIKDVVEKIKSFFKFQWELPKIPLPHFKIEGSFSIAPPRVPKLSVDWYKKAMQDGMILSTPTVLPAANGTLRGYGDAGPEAVVGVSSLRQMVQSAVQSALPKAGAARNMTVVLAIDGNEFARTEVPYIDSEYQRLGVKLAKA